MSVETKLLDEYIENSDVLLKKKTTLNYFQIHFQKMSYTFAKDSIYISQNIDSDSLVKQSYKYFTIKLYLVCRKL